MTAINGTNLAAPIVPFTTEDFFPTHKAQYGQGGWHEVATIEERDAIPSARREAGMAVYITSEAKLYILGENLVDWYEFEAGSANSIRKTSNLYNFDPLYDGEIVQYTGEDESGSDYINGYFYKATFLDESGEESGLSYVWEQVNIQPETVLEWGKISGTLANQTDLKEALDSKIPQVSNLNVGAYPRTQDAIVQYIGENTTDEVSGEPYINGYFYKCKLEPFAEGIGWLIWRKIAVQDGNINDVKIYGNSTVTDHVANLTVVEQLDENTMPFPTAAQLGRIIQYTGANGLVSGYIRGYFYECKAIEIPSSVEVETDTQEGSTMSDVGCQKDIIEYNYHPTTNMNWEFIYNGEENRWTLDDEVVDILDWGLYFNGSAVDGDTIYLEYDVARTEYRWVATETQAQPEIETITNAEIDEMWS